MEAADQLHAWCGTTATSFATSKLKFKQYFISYTMGKISLFIQNSAQFHMGFSLRLRIAIHKKLLLFDSFERP